jgi:hypothetical protein
MLMILASQSNEFLIIAIIGVIVIAVALLIYFIVTGRKKEPEQEPNNNFAQENQNLNNEVVPVVQNNQVEAVPVANEPTPVAEEQKALEEEKTDTNIQTLLNQMQQDLDNAPSNNYEDSISRYEDEEEENAIISYTELMKYKENHEKDILLEEKNKDEIKELIKEDKPKEEVKKFKRSEFISPIFGYNDDSNVTYREIKRPPRKEKVNYEPEWESDRMLKELQDDTAEVIEFEETKEPEIDKNDKFLDELVDFRNKLN